MTWIARLLGRCERLPKSIAEYGDEERQRRLQLANWNGHPHHIWAECWCCPDTRRPRTDARASRPT